MFLQDKTRSRFFNQGGLFDADYLDLCLRWPRGPSGERLHSVGDAVLNEKSVDTLQSPVNEPGRKGSVAAFLALLEYGSIDWSIVVAHDQSPVCFGECP